jgi:hypothetical protein
MKPCLAIISSLFYIVGVSQNPVHWKYSIREIATKTYETHLTAVMDKGWHIYAQAQPKESIAVPTKFEFTKNPLVIFEGSPKEIGKKETYKDNIAGITQFYYEDSVVYVQVIKLKANAKTSLNGTVTYQPCTNERCLKEKTEQFSISLY